MTKAKVTRPFKVLIATRDKLHSGGHIEFHDTTKDPARKRGVYADDGGRYDYFVGDKIVLDMPVKLAAELLNVPRSELKPGLVKKVRMSMEFDD
jgi:hypothetical protein